VNRSARIALAVGLGIAIVLIVRTGAGNIAALLSRAGWKLLWLVPLQVLPLMLDALGWRCLIPSRVRLMRLFAIVCIRQAMNRLLPVANVGGDIVGIRLLAKRGVDGSAATASVIIELMLGIVAQYLFVAFGVACLLALTGNARLTRALILGLGLALPPMILMALLLRHGRVFARMTHLGRQLFGRWLADAQGLDVGDRLESAVQGILGAGLRPLQSVGWQLAGFLAGCSETWLAMRWLGTPVNIAEAIVLESLTQGAKSILFLVPASFGVQEAGLVGVGHILGLPSDAALALSMAKRVREILFGVPALIAWQYGLTARQHQSGAGEQR